MSLAEPCPFTYRDEIIARVLRAAISAGYPSMGDDIRRVRVRTHPCFSSAKTNDVRYDCAACDRLTSPRHCLCYGAREDFTPKLRDHA